MNMIHHPRSHKGKHNLAPYIAISADLLQSPQYSHFPTFNYCFQRATECAISQQNRFEIWNIYKTQYLDYSNTTDHKRTIVKIK